MKTIFRMLCAAVLLPVLSWGDVEDLGGGEYKVTGTFRFDPDNEMLVPAGKGNTYGEFKIIIFKPSVLEYPGIREMTAASQVVFKVKGRPGKSGVDGEPVLIVEQILEWEGGPQEAVAN